MTTRFNLDKFKYDSNYKEESNFTRIKFGHDTGVLETELNEMQILQEKSRVSLTRRLMPSGFIELVQKEFAGSSIVYNPVDMAITKLNHIALAPARVMINGYELNLEGNFSYNGYSNYMLVDLGDAPNSGVRDDLVYLEVWFQTMSADDNVKKWGYVNGDSLGTLMKDPRVNMETSRRVVMCWNIRVAQNVYFNNFSDGFGYNDITDYSPIYAIANGQLGYGTNPNLIFAHASHEMFKNCEFYKDNNLWVAGRPSYDFGSPTIFGNYIYALPLFRIKRRNKQQFSIENFNGALSFNDVNLSTDSSVKGDLNDHIRPDKLSYDYIVAQDLVDLRRTIACQEFTGDYYLDKGLKQLFTGQLQTKETVKTRRLQFGNTKTDYTNNAKAIFVCQFNKTATPNKPVTTPVADSYTYKDSVGGYGIYMDGTSFVKYNVGGISASKGTIDFFFQPYWHGPDSTVSQTILQVLDNSDNPIFVLEKKGTKMIFSQYDSSKTTTNTPVVNKVILDLANHILLAKNIYHIRLSWNSAILGSANGSYIYVNGKLMAQGSYIPGRLIPSKVQIGKIETLDNTGFVMEDLVVYNDSFDVMVSNGNGYGYVQNSTWPNLPKDFIASDALLLPSFNSISNNFSDNAYVQESTIVQLSPSNTTGNKQYTLTVPSGRIINSLLRATGTSPKVYDLNGGEISGTWTGLGTSIAIFQTTSSTLTNVIVQFDMSVPAGNGGYDLPNEILAAGLLNSDGSIQEISFNRRGNDVARKVKFARQRRISGMIDSACDFSNSPQRIIQNVLANARANGVTTSTFTITAPTGKVINAVTSDGTAPQIFNLNGQLLTATWTGLGTATATATIAAIVDEVIINYDVPTRMNDQCFARLLYYNINGDGTDEYTVPMNLYGYTVLGIQSVKSRKITKVVKLPDENGSGTFSIKFDKSVAPGEVITFEIALGGMTFDYETQSKTLMSNLCKTRVLQITSTGDASEYVIPCFQSESAHGGILKAVFTFTDNVFDANGNLIDSNHPKTNICYMDSETAVDSNGVATGLKAWKAMPYTVDPASFGTPFIKIKFPTNAKPPLGVSIQVPVLVSYQLSELDILSIWYSYVPYQGILSNEPKQLKRISNWKYFITTLSSGKIALNIDEDNVYSLNNIVNRLPGGLSYAFKVDGKAIKFNHLSSIFSKADANPQLVFVKDIVYGSKNNNFDNYFFELDTDFIIEKTGKGFQDGNLKIEDKSFIVYLPDCTDSITKYLGMACLVVDEFGEIMLLVLGSLYDSPDTINKLTPVYGDLFKIPSLPTTIQIN